MIVHQLRQKEALSNGNPGRTQGYTADFYGKTEEKDYDKLEEIMEISEKKMDNLENQWKSNGDSWQTDAN